MIYFISGHRNLSYEDFERYYIPIIDKVVEEDKNAEFVVGDCNGVDKFAIDYIFRNGSNYLTVYHMSDKPRNIPESEVTPFIDLLQFRGGFKSDEERDSAMTKDSDFDIAFVKDNRWNSGTAQNIKRRHNII